jgi:nitroreductase
MSINLANADELLTTTRAVRKRIDLTRPVPREVILDCIRVSQQAPTGSNSQGWRWLIVTDKARKQALADLYRSVSTDYFTQASKQAEESGNAQTSRVFDSASYLAQHMQDMPALVIPCLMGRPGPGVAGAGGFFASIYPAMWNFCLALRARGLGSALTTLHLVREQDAAKLLGIPDNVTQAALLPVGYTVGDQFKQADRPAPETITFFDTWGQA